MLPPMDDTITAQASARGAAYRGIVRVSGPDTVAALCRWFRVSADSCASQDDAAHHSPLIPHPSPLPCIVDGELTVWSDELPVPCVLYYWPEGRGFTGQQAVELHTIGSQPLLDAILRTLCESGCRLAVAGEFTLRAFLSGRIDLPQAEAVLGVIDADDRRQLDVALRQLAGGVGRPLAALRERLLEITCHLEAEFDFADEDIEFLDRDQLRSELAASLAMIEQMRRQIQQRASTSERPRVVLIGRPNAGKSSLFNAMVQSCSAAATPEATKIGNLPSAIVSPQPGTTRDWLEAELQIREHGDPQLGALHVTLLDTAGIETMEADGNDIREDQPRQLAQVFTRDAVEQAQLVLLCIETHAALTESERAFLRENAERTMIVRTKSDQSTNVPSTTRRQVPNRGLADASCSDEACSDEACFVEVTTSAITGEGLPELLDAIASRLQRAMSFGRSTGVSSGLSTGVSSGRSTGMHGEVVPATALRCRESLSRAAESLQNALHLVAGRHTPFPETPHDDLLIATEMRVALEHIGQMTGAVHNDEILDRIFSRFCIGK